MKQTMNYYDQSEISCFVDSENIRIYCSLYHRQWYAADQSVLKKTTVWQLSYTLAGPTYNVWLHKKFSDSVPPFMSSNGTRTYCDSFLTSTTSSVCFLWSLDDFSSVLSFNSPKTWIGESKLPMTVSVHVFDFHLLTFMTFMKMNPCMWIQYYL